jgi:hypothetical protein
MAKFNGFYSTAMPLEIRVFTDKNNISSCSIAYLLLSIGALNKFSSTKHRKRHVTQPAINSTKHENGI